MKLEPVSAFDISYVFFAITCLLLIAYEAGFRIAVLSKNKPNLNTASLLNQVVNGLLRSLTFFLAFTFAMAVNNQNDRKRSVLNEVNAISDTYLYSELISSHQTIEVKSLLREYVDIRIKGVAKEHRQAALDRSLEIHQRLWLLASEESRKNSATSSSMFARSISTLVNRHEQRMSAGLYVKISPTIWLALLLTSILTMLVIGVNASMGQKRNFLSFIPLCLSYSVLISLVIDLDRPQSGLITISQQSMEALQNKMK